MDKYKTIDKGIWWPILISRVLYFQPSIVKCNSKILTCISLSLSRFSSWIFLFSVCAKSSSLSDMSSWFFSDFILRLSWNKIETMNHIICVIFMSLIYESFSWVILMSHLPFRYHRLLCWPHFRLVPWDLEVSSPFSCAENIFLSMNHESIMNYESFIPQL